jgi:hypothetical protein
MLPVRSAKQDAGGKTVDALEAEIAILIALATEAEDSGELTKLKALADRVRGALAEADDSDSVSLATTDVEAMSRLLHYRTEGLEKARDIEAVWRAASGGDDTDPRYRLLQLAFDGFNQRWWIDQYTKIDEREREALEAYRSNASAKSRLGQIAAVMGWTRPDRRRRPGFNADSVATHFVQITRLGGTVELYEDYWSDSAATPLAVVENCPLGAWEAISELATAHKFASSEACLRNLQQTRSRNRKLSEALKPYSDHWLIKNRLKYIPNLSKLPYRWGD